MDKTGTLTEAHQDTIEFTGEHLSMEEQQMVKSLVQHSTHPLSQKIFRALDAESTLSVKDFQESCFPQRRRGSERLVRHRARHTDIVIRPSRAVFSRSQIDYAVLATKEPGVIVEFITPYGERVRVCMGELYAIGAAPVRAEAADSPHDGLLFTLKPGHLFFVLRHEGVGQLLTYGLVEVDILLNNILHGGICLSHFIYPPAVATPREPLAGVLFIEKPSSVDVGVKHPVPQLVGPKAISNEFKVGGVVILLGRRRMFFSLGLFPLLYLPPDLIKGNGRRALRAATVAVVAMDVISHSAT